MRICNKCMVEKEIVEFAFKRKEKNERRKICKDCCHKYQKIHYQKNKNWYIKRAKTNGKKQRERNQLYLLDYLKSKKCIDCGNNDVRVLEFDHQRGVDKKNNIADMMHHFSWKKILEEIEKCDIRCANCHRIKTMKQTDCYKNCKFDLIG